MTITLPNVLSLLRFPLALLLLKENIFLRSFAIIMAMLTDGLDGFIARKYQQTSYLGRLLDPLMDRFFIFVALGILIKEGTISPLELTALASRDIAIAVFGIYLVLSGRLSRYRFGAIWCGKITTFLQFLVFLGLVYGLPPPPAVYLLFVFLGTSALFELYLCQKEETL